ncbi:MAG: hypothetical protein HQL94_09865 [Magnetococcales bacterium]|nr:hypothetical protein [Magnetococcales bacterium]MBF0438512.1 hypothetical protein [Magnetococcales bacterium]
MTCRVDEILNDSREMIRETILKFADDLTTDFNLEATKTETLLNSSAYKTLQGALETFAVGFVNRKK